MIADKSESIASVLENRLGDIGMDVSDARGILSGMLAVQNTYLRTFQSLGGLGLLLGTIGLAVAQLRSVLERRQELAVMRAIGFTRKRLAGVVMSETASLLLMGIGCGAICAVLAVLAARDLERSEAADCRTAGDRLWNHPVRDAGRFDRGSKCCPHAATGVTALGVNERE